MVNAKEAKPTERLYRQVVEKMLILMDSGEYPVGSRLPAERELAERFGVSRPTIREAVIALEAKGRVSVKTGSGVYVTKEQASPDSLGGNLSPFELVEARVLIEGEAAALAASMISDEELLQLKQALDDMQSDDASSTIADRKFHSIISNATQNRVFPSVVMRLWSLQENLEDIRMAHQAVCMRDQKVRIAEHTAIYNALAARNPQAARGAMRNHFSRLITALHETKEQEAVTEARLKVSQMRERYSFDRFVDAKTTGIG